MAEKYEPPVTDALMALLASAAPLFEKAKASGMFRGWPPPPTPAAATPAADDAAADPGQKAALQEIIVAQAMKIHALEAEIARLKG